MQTPSGDLGAEGVHHFCIARPSIVVVIAALDYIMCSLSRDNDDAHEDFCTNSRR